MTNQLNSPTKRALSIRGFCEAYGIGRTKAYEEIAAGRLLAFRVGTRRLIQVADADQWLESYRAASLTSASATTLIEGRLNA